jgi:hypothetical protein
MGQGKVIVPVAALAALALATRAQAVCPVCSVAVGTGVGLSRWAGVDDSITGLWLGGLTVSLILWTLDWLDSRNIRFKGRGLITTAAYYLLLCAPLYFGGMLGHPLNVLFGVDKLLLGIGVGSLAFLGGALWYLRIKEMRKGHALFPFQKVVMPVLPLFILSLLFYYLAKRM